VIDAVAAVVKQQDDAERERCANDPIANRGLKPFTAEEFLDAPIKNSDGSCNLFSLIPADSQKAAEDFVDSAHPSFAEPLRATWLRFTESAVVPAIGSLFLILALAWVARGFRPKRRRFLN
jgi:hypothetical protein